MSNVINIDRKWECENCGRVSEKFFDETVQLTKYDFGFAESVICCSSDCAVEWLGGYESPRVA
jgi:hypothetical protein